MNHYRIIKFGNDAESSLPANHNDVTKLWHQKQKVNFLLQYSRTSVIGPSIIGTIRYLAQICPDGEIAYVLYRALIP